MAIYVCSDIHGSFDHFKAMLKKINFSKEDKVYIIGDILDKGPDPIKLADFCMNNDNIILLMGNHELMFIKAYTEKDQEGIWFSNGGLYTCKQFESLSANSQDDIFDYIQTLPVIIKNLSVGNKNFYLSHATYYPDSLAKFRDSINMLELGDKETSDLLWARDYPFHKLTFSTAYQEYKNSILISGHTPGINLAMLHPGTNRNSKAFIFHNKKGHYINVDCGLAYRYAPCKRFIPRMGCLRLDDMKEFYIDA